jgi:hypothetical protein
MLRKVRLPMARYTLLFRCSPLSWQANSCVRVVRRSREAHRQGSGDCFSSWRGRHSHNGAEPLADQWMYHAVADTVLANSLLRSFPEVDAKKVGLMGISWGGVVASTAMGVDTRFAFSIPTCGCGDLADTPNQYGAALHDNALYRDVWDPLVWLPHATMPALWLSWPDDVHFPLTSQSASYRAAPGPHMAAILPGMKHGHPAGWNPPDSYAFAESVVREGKPWFRQTSDGEFFNSKPIDKALLFSTADAHSTVPSQWTQTPAAFEQGGTHVGDRDCTSWSGGIVHQLSSQRPYG